MSMRHPIRRQHGGRVLLCMSCGLITLIWLVVLPWAARRPAMEDHLRRLESRGIDPSAMYYTDLEALQPILERWERESQAGPR